jgi:carbon storage regulator CsrA
MLVLTRKRSESIRIGNDIVIKVIQTGRGTVKLGIEAPAHVRVLRAELTEFASPLGAAREPEESRGEEQQECDADAVLENECFLEFSTEFAMELEDQMLCVAAH